MKITVNTRNYQIAHGKSPRGFGQWGFYMGEEKHDSIPIFFTGNYADAKKQAVKYARENGFSRVIVGS